MPSDSRAGAALLRTRSGRRLLVFLALLHLTIAGSFALIDGVSRYTGQLPIALALPLRLYGAVTGGTAGYGFFSPDIAPEIRAHFEIVTADGKRQPVSLTGANREADLRVGNLVNLHLGILVFLGLGTFALTMMESRKLDAHVGDALAGLEDRGALE